MEISLRLKQDSQIKRNSRKQVIATLNHLDHVLPGQGPIADFVHHNTLHGYQHMPFEEALAAFEALTGISGYLPESQNRKLYQQGRINEHDLLAALAHDLKLQTEKIIHSSDGMIITQKDIYCIALLFDLQALNVSQLNWQIEEMGALSTLQADVPESVRNRLFEAGVSQKDMIRNLWECISDKLGLKHTTPHPENMFDLSPEQARDWLARINPTHLESRSTLVHQRMEKQSGVALNELLDQVGDGITLRGFLMALSGIDILDFVRPQLIRICASAMDEGVAAWQLPERNHLGLYAAWMATAQYDLSPLFLHNASNWQQVVAKLPKDPVDSIILQLRQMEIPEEKWDGYLRRLALELPGWSGLINWRQHHPKYYAENDAAPKLADYLAIRLILDRLWLNQTCQEIWGIEASLNSLWAYFRDKPSEFMVRKFLYQGVLPEYLTQSAESLVKLTGTEQQKRSNWRQLASLIWTWQFSPMVENTDRYMAFNEGWRLFRLFQHLGLSAAHVQKLQTIDLQQILEILDRFNVTERSKVWLYAYEHNYREAFFQALRANYKRGRWAERNTRPDSQVIFCIDDREESFRRHLEEFNPAIETLGAAGFFGVPMNYKALDDTRTTPLCPIVVTPAHEVQEVPRTDTEYTLARHKRGYKIAQQTIYLIYQRLRGNLLLSLPIIHAIAPVTFIGLVAKSLFPKKQRHLISTISEIISPTVKTQLMFTSTDNVTIASPEQPKLGFTDNEQADRVSNFLRNSGLTRGFSELVVLMGHGSISQNNPHLAAYDCGACSGRHGGPSARLFAAMANRSEIRKLVAERDINIPPDTWFIGAEHNTCNEKIDWYDVNDVPVERLDKLQKIQKELRHAQLLSAHERCRRLASAPRDPTPEQALVHMEERATDFSQARPELGHATNASAVVGRRSITQGTFLDRRAFLISYDPTYDPEGKTLEGILLNVGPVGAGINLEYYFSTVNNERFGCGTKIPHNLTGNFAVMEGTSSDLRTGLPRQMIEIHEAVRLQILVEAKTSVLGEIYNRQESLRELIGGGWVLLSAIDPDSGDIFIFERGVGFVPWKAEAEDLPVYEKSPDCYQSKIWPLSPVLIKQPDTEKRVIT
ncbi:MAG: DUF2309 domain-containing protein [Nitrosomonadaceae bacterium]